MKNLRNIIEKEILYGELREIKYKNLISDYKKTLKCKRSDCQIFSDFKNIILFFTEYQKNKEKFYVNLIHDIKSPLMSIDFALRNNHDGEIIDDVYYTNLESLKFIENVLALYNQKNELKFSKFDLLEIINVILRNHKYLLIEKGLDIIFNPKIEKYQIISCPVCLGRIISNFISNAIKYSPSNKKIEIKLNFYKSIISFSVINEINENPSKYCSNGLGLNISKLIAKKINGKISSKKSSKKIEYTLDFIPLQEGEYNLH